MWVLKGPNPSMFNTYGATGTLGLWVLRGGMVLFICLETHPGANSCLSVVLNFAPISISTFGELNINECTLKVLEGVKVRRCEVLHPRSK